MPSAYPSLSRGGEPRYMPPSRRTPLPEIRHEGQEIEVAIDVKDLELISEGTDGNEAVRAGSDRETALARPAKEGCRLEEGAGGDRGLDEREGEQRFANLAEGPVLANALQDLLDHGQAQDDLVEGHESV